MRRPYRHVETDALEKDAARIYVYIQSLTNSHYTTLIPEQRRELARVSKELDRRARRK